MTQTFWGLINELDNELVQINSLIKGAVCIRENNEDANVETNLLALAEEKGEVSREVLKEINQEYRNLEKGKKKPEATPTQQWEGI